MENILNCHPDIAEWYEPYYLWERHFSTEKDVQEAAVKVLEPVRLIDMKGLLSVLGPLYQVGHFVKR